MTVLTPYHTVCDNTEGSTKEPLYERLYQRDVKMLVDTRLVGIEPAAAGKLRVRAANEYSDRPLALDDVDIPDTPHHQLLARQTRAIAG